MSAIYKIFRKPSVFNSVKSLCCASFVRHKTQSKQENFDKEFLINYATPSDYEEAMDLLRKTFLTQEPTIVGIGLNCEKSPILESLMLDCLKEGMSLVATFRATGCIVGVAANGVLCSWDPDELTELANKCTCRKTAEVLRFYAFISKAPKLWDKYKEKKIFEIGIVGIDNSCEGRGITFHLVQRSLALAKDLRYNVVRVTASNVHTQSICKKLNLNMVYEYRYDSYINTKGKPIFEPPPPNQSVKVFVSFPHAPK